MTHPTGYLAIGGGYSYAPLRCGLVLRNNVTDKEIYFQPGDDESAIRAEIEALDELSGNIETRHISEDKFNSVCDMVLGDYFNLED